MKKRYEVRGTQVFDTELNRYARFGSVSTAETACERLNLGPDVYVWEELTDDV